MEPTDLAQHLNQLPMLSAAVQRIAKTLTDQTASAHDVVEALRSDPSVAARVLRMANSAYFGLPNSVASLQNAAALLGNRRIRAMVLSSAATDALRAPAPCAFSLEDFWAHSAATAVMCESVAKHLRRSRSVDPSEFFSAGLLHDVGKLLLARFEPEATAHTARTCVQTGIPYYQAEDALLRHTAAGELLAMHWRFPRELAMAAAHHHAPGAQERSDIVVDVVHLSDSMAHAMGFCCVCGENAPPVDEGVLERVALPVERLKVIAQEALAKSKDIRTFTAAVS